MKKGKKTKHQIKAIICETEAGMKLEILTPDGIKEKALKGLYFHQETIKQKEKKLHREKS